MRDKNNGAVKELFYDYMPLEMFFPRFFKKARRGYRGQRPLNPLILHQKAGEYIG